jgi:hypothetical protein
MARITWNTAARGGKVFPLLLIHGLPYVLTLPFGHDYIPSGVSLSDLPDLWWPGTDLETISGYARGWLELGEGVEGFAWTEQSRPTEATQVDLGQIVVRLSDPAGEATAVFDSADAATGTYLTAEVTVTDSTVHVVSTDGFPSSGVLYLNREAIAYAGTTSTSFTGCTRGQYGSQAQRHPYDAAAGSGLGTAEVTDRPTEFVGRLCTLWMGQVEGGVLTKLSLEYCGHVGVGPQVPEDGADGWVLNVDHAAKRLGQKPRAATVTVGGYVHAGNRGARNVYSVDGTDHYGRNLLRDGTTPVADLFATGASTAWRYTAVLTEDAAEPDNGGWHHDRQAYVDALNQAVLAELGAGDALSYRLEGGHLVAEWRFGTPRPASLYWAFDYAAAAYYPPDVTTRTSGHEMPEAWVPVLPNSRIYLSATDYAAVPPVPAAVSGDATTAYWALVWEAPGEGGGTTRCAAKILSAISSGGVHYVTVLPVLGATRVGVGGAERVGGDAFRRAGGFLITQPTVCRVALYVASDSWVTALERAVTVFSDDLGDGASQVFDWDRMREVARQYGGPFATRREYLIDADSSVLEFVANELSLQGFCLVPWRGKLAIARLAEFAATETRAGAITTASLDAESPVPGYSRGEDGICNTFVLEVPESKLTLNFVDQTSRAKYGPSSASIKVTLPGGLFPRSVDGAQLAASLGAMAMTTLGPLRYPYRHVAVGATLLHYDLQIGDLVSVSLYNIPNGSGTRGLPGPLGVSVAQVVARSPTLFREGTEGLVHFTLRLSPANLTGWAPGALIVSASALTGEVTLDTSTFGVAGCAQGGTDGGAATFSVGDAVRLVELGTASPTSSTQHTVTAVAGDVVTVSPAPGGVFASGAYDLAALVFDDWDEVVTAQAAWCFLADTNLQLVDGAVSTRARRYAA